MGRQGAVSITSAPPLFTPHSAALARLPPPCRAEILKQYARHLSDAEVLAVAHATPGMAGRDLKDICEQAERRWASKVRFGGSVRREGGWLIPRPVVVGRQAGRPRVYVAGGAR